MNTTEKVILGTVIVGTTGYVAYLIWKSYNTKVPRYYNQTGPIQYNVIVGNPNSGTNVTDWQENIVDPARRA